MKRRIYVSGPMDGMPGFNYPLFDEAARRLAAKGWEVVNPADIGRLYANRCGKTPAEMAADPAILANLLKDEISTLRECDAIFLLDGWNDSTGAKTELFHALERNMSVILQGDLDRKEADGAQ